MTKNTEVLPRPIIIASFFVTLQWFIYGYLINDSFIQVKFIWVLLTRQLNWNLCISRSRTSSAVFFQRSNWHFSLFIHRKRILSTNRWRLKTCFRSENLELIVKLYLKPIKELDCLSILFKSKALKAFALKSRIYIVERGRIGEKGLQHASRIFFKLCSHTGGIKSAQIRLRRYREILTFVTKLLIINNFVDWNSMADKW